jgi:hypothetical protein
VAGNWAVTKAAQKVATTADLMAGMKARHLAAQRVEYWGRSKAAYLVGSTAVLMAQQKAVWLARHWAGSKAAH